MRNCTANTTEHRADQPAQNLHVPLLLYSVWMSRSCGPQDAPPRWRENYCAAKLRLLFSVRPRSPALGDWLVSVSAAQTQSEACDLACVHGSSSWGLLAGGFWVELPPREMIGRWSWSRSCIHVSSGSTRSSLAGSSGFRLEQPAY